MMWWWSWWHTGKRGPSRNTETARNIRKENELTDIKRDVAAAHEILPKETKWEEGQYITSHQERYIVLWWRYEELFDPNVSFGDERYLYLFKVNKYKNCSLLLV